jgi:hypothetical protein
MPESRRAWKEDEIQQLKAMAEKIPGELIAAELSRSHGALAVKACELGLSLRTIPRGKRRIGASAPSVP